MFLAYGCEVDEFQHIMYQNPDLTPDQRNAEWLKQEKKIKKRSIDGSRDNRLQKIYLKNRSKK